MTAVARTPGYREIRELGSGSQGRVALARREQDGAYVAIKYLPAKLLSSPAESSRFRAEAHMLAQLDDPHIQGGAQSRFPWSRGIFRVEVQA
jgi:serine/threonine protein kinase